MHTSVLCVCVCVCERGGAIDLNHRSSTVCSVQSFNDYCVDCYINHFNTDTDLLVHDRTRV